jgi:hypothetical protein
MANDNNDDEKPRGINNLNIRDEVSEDVPSELPEQMGGIGMPVLLPGTHIFRIPQTVAQLIESYDEIVKDANGNAVADPADPSKALLVQRLRVRFDKDDPLVVVGTPEDGQPVATSISNQPRNRARKGEARILVSDMAYLLRESMKYTGPLTKNSEWAAALQWSAGRVFRCEHGLSGYCNPEKVRYINDPSDPTFRGSIQDPSGQKGCGGGPDKKRLYTSHFKLPAQNGQPGGFSDIAYCQFCQAKLRGFFQVERFLKPTEAMLADEVPF